jgi:deoxyribodipyrimidine photo-lyase
VFTPFRRAWLRAPPLRPDVLATPARLPPIPAGVSSEPIPVGASPQGFPAGEHEAVKRLKGFTEADGTPIEDYVKSRNRLDREGTSALSPYLRFGMLSPRLAALVARERAEAAATATAREGPAAWLDELIWRDFYLAVLHHFPDVLSNEFDAGLRGIRWRNDSNEIEAWKAGRTGYPVVDAAMRQLAVTGWMHNRSRMIVASFLVKHLLVDWRIGEAWFMQALVDGDPAANNGGWQWAAGTGTDPAPYFRVFNPVSQGKRFDPEGRFVRRWLPELARVPERYLHEPWTMPVSVQADSGVHIGLDYPAPIVGLAEGRARALAAYREARLRP